MISWFRHGDVSRPPLAGRLVGLALGVLLLSVAVHVALGVLTALVALTVPPLVIAFLYGVMFGRARRR